MANILITGTGGPDSLGHAVAKACQVYGHTAIGATLYNADTPWHEDYDEYHCDVRDINSIMLLEEKLSDQDIRVDILVNCAGTHELSYLEDLSLDAWDSVINTNARGIYLMTKVFLGHLSLWREGTVPEGATSLSGSDGFYQFFREDSVPEVVQAVQRQEGGSVLNILSTASHVPMTASLAYQASKGAAAIMTQQLARELMPRHNITVFGVSPNKIAGTGMSQKVDKTVCEVRGWSEEEMKRYSDSNICCGEETDKEALADYIAYLLSSKERHKYLAGCIMPYGHQR